MPREAERQSPCTEPVLGAWEGQPPEPVSPRACAPQREAAAAGRLQTAARGKPAQQPGSSSHKRKQSFVCTAASYHTGQGNRLHPDQCKAAWSVDLGQLADTHRYTAEIESSEAVRGVPCGSVQRNVVCVKRERHIEALVLR
ncbi:hypothetical protein MG293_000023 [Ovis ammon polii]|uniref:Uncharacterized protein n=1 Tax=Ovis ammon polii TaxID=230172 RepID=A0AAD4YH35_OVIAM|nr:hypothetical protein MG293_000023 [Ovis ammon polii]